MTTPKIIETYKNVYDQVILQQELINERIKSMEEADKIIKTEYIEPEKEFSTEVKKRLARQKAKLMYRGIMDDR